MTIRKGLVLSSAVLALLVAVTVAAALMMAPKADVNSAVRSLGMFKATKWTEHYRVPSDAQVETILDDQGISLAGPDARTTALETFRKLWVERNPTTPYPEKLDKLLGKERLNAVAAAPAVATPQIMSLAVPVEFPNSDTFDAGPPWGVVTTTGPLHNQIPAPGPRDNNSVWYKDATPALYNELYFGVGPKAGVIINHPNLGKVDLRGNTMANYYLEQSEGTFQPVGSVYPKWLQAAHSEGWYGADNASGNNNVRAQDLVREVIDGINADDPDFPWQNYDGDGNGIVDNFTVIHAGAGQEGGGGQQGGLRHLVARVGHQRPQRLSRVRRRDPRGHTRHLRARVQHGSGEHRRWRHRRGVRSCRFWSAGYLHHRLPGIASQLDDHGGRIVERTAGGMEPAPFPLYFRYLVGWASPVELDYATGPVTTKVGQLSKRPKDTQQGVKINLPDQVVSIPNRAGTGGGWWSDRADNAEFYLAHDFDLTGATAPIFSFASYWSIEEDWDYGYVEVSR